MDRLPAEPDAIRKPSSSTPAARKRPLPPLPRPLPRPPVLDSNQDPEETAAVNAMRILASQNYVGGNIIGPVLSNNQIIQAPPANENLFETLRPYVNFNAAYNSKEREDDQASCCQPDTRRKVLKSLSGWMNDKHGRRICWLSGPAGAGKSTIAHTVAQELDQGRRLAFSYFFSRRHQHRDDMTKFVPTFAYRLAKAIPALEQPMVQVLKDHPGIFYERIGNQLEQLIISLIKQQPSSKTMTVVIDGLDEYSQEAGNMDVQDLVRLLLQLPTNFRVLFASRSEAYIAAVFDLPLISHETRHILLQDFEAFDDVQRYLRTELSKVAEKRKIAQPWPSNDILNELAHKSEGLFIYASTLIRFVDNKHRRPEKQLELARTAHKGLDSLFEQVLNQAKEFANFELVFGAVVLLRERPPISILPSLLGLDGLEDVIVALDGCLSILNVPNYDPDDYIRPYHASLLDFLLDSSRGKDLFIPTAAWHSDFASRCLVILNDKTFTVRPSIRFAAVYWCFHLHQALRRIPRTQLQIPAQVLEVRSCLVLIPSRNSWVSKMKNFGDIERISEYLVQVVGYISRWPDRQDFVAEMKEFLRRVENFATIFAVGNSGV